MIDDANLAYWTLERKSDEEFREDYDNKVAREITEKQKVSFFLIVFLAACSTRCSF